MKIKLLKYIAYSITKKYIFVYLSVHFFKHIKTNLNIILKQFCKKLIMIFLSFISTMTFPILANAGSEANSLPKIPVSIAKFEKLRTTSSFIGKVVAQEKVDIKSTINGKLKSIGFKDGSPVEKGQVLFEIEPEKYELEMKQNEATLKADEASLANEKIQLQRSEFLAKNKAIAQSQLDKQKIQTLQSEAKVELSRINLYASKLKLQQTQIKAPITGRVGRSYFSVGSDISPESGVLTKIVNDKIVKIYFPVTQKELIQGLKRKDDNNTLKISIQLSDGTILKEKAILDFLDITTDEKTDTISLRAEVNNSEGLLLDGEIVQVVGTRNSSDKYITIPHKSVLIDQNGAYCFVIDDSGTVIATRILTDQENGQNIVVKSGINIGDKVVVSSDKIQPGMKVEPVLIP